MLRTKSIFLVLILFILINTDLSVAKGLGGGIPGGTPPPLLPGSRGGGSRGGYKGYGGSYYGGGGGSFNWETLMYVVIGIVVFCSLCCMCCLCVCAEKDNERNISHNSNEIENRSIVVQEIPQRYNEASMNAEIRNQFHENLSHNSHHITNLSPHHLSYPISLVNIPPNEQNQSYYASGAVSQPLDTVPQVPENHNLKAKENLENGTILSHSLTQEAVSPPYPSNQGTWIN